MVSNKICNTCKKFDLNIGVFGKSCPLYAFNRKIEIAGNMVFTLSIIKYTGCTFYQTTIGDVCPT